VTIGKQEWEIRPEPGVVVSGLWLARYKAR